MCFIWITFGRLLSFRNFFAFGELNPASLNCTANHEIQPASVQHEMSMVSDYVHAHLEISLTWFSFCILLFYKYGHCELDIWNLPVSQTISSPFIWNISHWHFRLSDGLQDTCFLFHIPTVQLCHFPWSKLFTTVKRSIFTKAIMESAAVLKFHFRSSPASVEFSTVTPSIYGYKN